MVRTQLSRKASTNIRRRSSRLNRRQLGSGVSKQSTPEVKEWDHRAAAAAEAYAKGDAVKIKGIDSVKKTYGLRLRHLRTGELFKVEISQDATMSEIRKRIADELRIINPLSIFLDFNVKPVFANPDARLEELAWHYSLPLDFDYIDKNEEEQQFTEGDDDY